MLEHPLVTAITLGAATGVGFTIDETTGLSLGVIGAMTLVIFVAGRWFQRLLDAVKRLQEKIVTLEKTLSTRPCMKNSQCPVEEDETNLD